MTYEASVSLPAKLVGVQHVSGAKEANTPTAQDVEAMARAEKMRQEAREREHLERVLGNLAQAAAGLHAQQQEYLEEMQRLAMELAVTIAGHILHDQIQSGDFPMESVVRKVVERLETTRPVTVYLHPDDVALLEQRLGDKEIFPKKVDVHLVADPALGRGNCRAQAGDVSVLSDIEEQLGDLRRQLLDALSSAKTVIEPPLRQTA